MEAITIDPLTEVTNTELTLRWTPLVGVNKGGADVGIDSYDIQWDQGNGGEWTLLASMLVTETSHQHSLLTPDVTYGYRIRAVSEYGNAASFSDPTYI